MRLELTIKTTYLPEWKAWEGIRELIQNAKDAEVEFGSTMEVRHRKPNTLVIENTGGKPLTKEALLLGHTSKQGRSDLIGKFGEGLKLGVLALVREGARVKIRSGSEVWVPKIERSDKFDADVLAFYIHTGRKDEARTQIEIEGVNEEIWGQLRERFLFLSAPKEKYSVRTSYGTLILDPERVGQIFARGIFVQKDNFVFSYDLNSIDIDRDRRMVDRPSLRWRLSALWSEALNIRPDLMHDYIDMLERQAADLEGVDSYSAKQIPESVRLKIVKHFHATHGEQALPVQTLAQSAELEHLGRTGVVTTAGLRAVLEAQLGSTEETKQKLHKAPKQLFGWHELSAAEKKNLQDAQQLIFPIERVTLEDVDVCSFHDDSLQGLFIEGRILLGKHLLNDFQSTLSTLVHEVAHRAGSDGEKAHVSNIERIWSGIVMNTLNVRGAS